jgi:hypothetical protein
MAAALVVSLLANVVLAVRVKDARDDATRAARRATAFEEELEDLRSTSAPLPATGGVLDRIAAAVAKIRGLPFTRAVAPEILTDEQLAKRVREQFAKDDPKPEVDASDAVLTALGLLAPDADLYSVLIAVQTEQIGGFYDTKTKRLVVGGNATDPQPLDRVLLAHELTHALTDQHFGLSRLDDLQDRNLDDEAMAYLSLVEGDATETMLTYAQTVLTATERGQLAAEAGRIPSAQLDAAPKVLRDSLLFPYEEGRAFVRALIAKGGLALVDRAYRDPPASTEQILHPEKYTGRRDDPRPVSMPDLAKAMGGGWKPLQVGGIGEMDVRLIAGQYLPRADAVDAAKGWDGGRYAAVRSPAGTLVAVLTEWDSAGEATEAADLLSRWLPDRYGNRGTSFRVSGGRGWSSASGAGLVARSGTAVLLVVGPDRASAERALASFPKPSA